MDMPIGAADQCSADCANVAIISAKDGDGCCPRDHGANVTNDNDCKQLCGDGVKSGNESCDDSSATKCRTSCDDGNPCTIDIPSGNAATCDFACMNKPSTTAECLCGNGTLDPGEECDPASSTPCPTTCLDDGIALHRREAGR
jgi:hypothetical protein